MKEEILQLIERVRKSNTYKTSNGEWTVDDNTLTIKVSDLLKIINKK